MPTISLDTVYRTVATLTDLGLVRRVTLTPGPARYDANTSRHHHYVCTRCGLIRDVDDKRLDAVRAPRGTASLGTRRIGRGPAAGSLYRLPEQGE